MVSSRITVWAVTAVAAVSAIIWRSASAQEAAARSLTLADCLTLAADGNPDLRMAEDEVDAAGLGGPRLSNAAGRSRRG
jgi:hypothetical protein